MFALQYGDGFLELVDAESVVTKWVSTAFNASDKLQGSGSELPFELADTPANNKLLGYSNQLANRLARKEIEVVIWLFGMPWKRCKFSYNLKNGKINGFTKIDNAEFADVIKEKEIGQVFIKTKNGSFEDHEWISLGNTPLEVSASVANSHTPGAEAYCFFPYVNSGLFGAYSGEEGTQLWVQPDIINRWKNGEIIWRVADVPVLEQGEYWYTPFLYWSWVIKKVCSYLGYEAIGDFFDSDFQKTLVFDNTAVYSYADMWLNPTGFKFAPARHLPRIKINEFFKIIRDDFRVIYYFDSDTRQAHFTLSATVLDSQERIDLDGCIEKGRPTTDPTPESGFELVQGIDDDDELFELLPYTKSFFIGGDRLQKKIPSGISTTFMWREQNRDEAGLPYWRIPIKKQIGNAYGDVWPVGSQAHNPQDYGRNKFSLRLLSFHGLMYDSLGNLYPYACSDGLAPDGVTEISQSLWLGGSNGMIENYLRKWYAFLIRTEAVELMAYLTTLILCKLSPLKKIRFATTEGVHLEALLDEVRFSPSSKRLLRSELRVYPNYNVSGADDAINLDFVSGEIVNPTPFYVKIEEINDKRSYRRPLFVLKVLMRISADIVVSFYSDEAGTIPVSVNGLLINVIHQNINNLSFSSETKHYTCYGETYTILSGVEIFYQNGSTHRTAKMVLADGPGYLKL